MKLWVVLIIVIIMFFPFCGICALNTYTDAKGLDGIEAKKQFEKFAKEIDLKYKKVSCNDVDTDKDGYVSCTYTKKDDDSMHTIECAGAYNFQRGCRELKMKINP